MKRVGSAGADAAIASLVALLAAAGVAISEVAEVMSAAASTIEAALFRIIALLSDRLPWKMMGERPYFSSVGMSDFEGYFRVLGLRRRVKARGFSKGDPVLDPYPKLPKFLKKRLFTDRYVREQALARTSEADRIANEALVEMLFGWHREQFKRHQQYEELATTRDLDPVEMEQDNLAVSMMGFLEDAAAYVSSLERGSMALSTLRSYLQGKILLSVDILEGSEPHFALDHIVSRLRRIEEATAPLI